MGENNASAPTLDNVVSKLEKLSISSLGTEWLEETASLKKNNSRHLDLQSGVSKPDHEIDAELSQLQCPFTWSLPRTNTVPSLLVSKLTEKVKEIEEIDEFEMRRMLQISGGNISSTESANDYVSTVSPPEKRPKENGKTYDFKYLQIGNKPILRFICNLVIVFELCNDGKLDEAYKKLTSILCYLEDLYKNCKEKFFVDMKRPLQHIIQSYKAHLLKAYSVQLLPEHAQLYYESMDKILGEVYPYSEMTDVEKAGIYGFKAQIFSEYSYSGTVSALEFAKQASELDPNQADWHFLTGKILGRIRRCANWNDYVTKEEINLLEHAVQLHEKPSFMVFLACAYIECTRGIYRNIDVDKELGKKLRDMNTRAKQLFRRCLELNPVCAHVHIRCANGMIKLPKPFVDKDLVQKCIAFALEKAPNNGMVHHVAGMFAERHLYDIEKALHHYKISSDLCVFGATADYIRMNYIYDKDYDLLSALEKMLDNTEALPNKYNSLSCIGSYYLFLKRDLITALKYYRQVIDEDQNSSALKAHKPIFLNMKAPLNMYEILCTEVNLELNKNELSEEDKNMLKEFADKLNMLNPELSKEFADKPSRIQKILNEAVLLTDKYKSMIARQQKLNRREIGSYQSNYGNNPKSSVSRGRGRGRGGQQNVRRPSNTNAGSWRSKDNDIEEKELVEASGETRNSASAINHTSQPKKHDSFNNYMKISGKSKDISNGNNENEDPVSLKEHDAENKLVQKFQKNRSVQTIRDPYGPNEGGVQKSFERKRIPDVKWIMK